MKQLLVWKGVKVMARYIDAEKLKGMLRLDQAGAENTLRQDAHLHPVRKLEIKSHIGAIEYLIKEINDTPTADVVEVKHGHWIKRGNEKKCSVCGFIYYSNNDDWNGCPNCLAKMDGGK